MVVYNNTVPNTFYYNNNPCDYIYWNEHLVFPSETDNTYLWIITEAPGQLSYKPSYEMGTPYGQYQVTKTIQYSLDKGTTWATLPEYPTTVPLSAGQVVFFKSDSLDGFHYVSSATIGIAQTKGINFTDSYVVGGDITALFNWDWENITSNHCLSWFFRGQPITKQFIIFPSTNIDASIYASCYAHMFEDCSRLKNASPLPSASVGGGAYLAMYRNCISLLYPPELPATSLEPSAYTSMFYGCTSLRTAPILPATSLDLYCYKQMFYGCTSLTTIPALPATTIHREAYYNMFYGCTSLKFSETQTAECPNAFRIPTTGTGTAYTDALKNMFTGTSGTFTGTPTVNTTYYTNAEIIPAPQPVTVNYFYIKCLSGDGAYTYLNDGNTGYYPTLLYSTDRTNWASFGTTSIAINAGDTIYLKAGPNGNDGINNSNTNYAYNNFILTGGTFEIGGDVTTLMDENGNQDLSLAGQFHFGRIFYQQNNLVSVSNLVFPEKVGYCSFHNAFNGTGITTPPNLSNIKYVGYNGMGSAFRYCNSMTGTVDLSSVIGLLPTSESNHYAFNYTFGNCASLQGAILPNILPYSRCYNSLFNSDGQLTSITVPWTSWGDDTNYNWVYGVSGSGTFTCPAALGTDSTVARGVNYCPSGWTVVNT